MEQLKCEIDVSWSEEDEGYTADVPDLKYCSARGGTSRSSKKPVAPSRNRETARPFEA